MDILPVMDLREGSSSRVFERLHEKLGCPYSPDPLEQAQAFKDAGCEWIQIVDLDGAFAGRPGNLHIVKQVVEKVGLRVQFAGGLRDRETLDEALACGVDKVILSTAAIRNLPLVQQAVRDYGDKIVGGIDTKDGMVVVEGWESTVPKSGIILAKEMAEMGIQNILYSDVRRQGSLRGPNFAALEEVLGLGLSVFTSGGVSSIPELLRLQELGLRGVAIGKALYTGAVPLAEALAVTR